MPGTSAGSGQLAQRGSPLPTPGCRFFDPRLPTSTTRRGHAIIERARALFEEQGLPVIYGDTDLLFVHVRDSPTSRSSRGSSRSRVTSPPEPSTKSVCGESACDASSTPTERKARAAPPHVQAARLLKATDEYVASEIEYLMTTRTRWRDGRLRLSARLACLACGPPPELVPTDPRPG